MIYMQLLIAMASGIALTHENGGILTGIIGMVFAGAIGMKGAFPEDEEV